MPDGSHPKLKRTPLSVVGVDATDRVHMHGDTQSPRSSRRAEEEAARKFGVRPAVSALVVWTLLTASGCATGRSASDITTQPRAERTASVDEARAGADAALKPLSTSVLPEKPTASESNITVRHVKSGKFRFERGKLVLLVKDDTEGKIRRLVSEMKKAYLAISGRMATESLVDELGPDAVPALIDLLGDQNPTARGLSASYLAALKRGEAVPEIISLLDDEDDFSRNSAISALREIGDSRAIEPLKGLLSHENEYTRRAAAEAIKQVSARAAAR